MKNQFLPGFKVSKYKNNTNKHQILSTRDESCFMINSKDRRKLSFTLFLSKYFSANQARKWEEEKMIYNI